MKGLVETTTRPANMSDQDSDNQTPKEEALGCFESLEWAVSKYVQHVPTTLDGFLQLDVILT